MGKYKNNLKQRENSSQFLELTNIEAKTINGGGYFMDFLECFWVKRKEIVYEKMNNNSFLI